jgi:DNA primase
MMTEGLVGEIKARFDIVEVISDYLDLRRSGQNYKGLCPFHSEKTPSFMVSPDRQMFHCFGCGAGGDIVNFIMRYENLTFPESLRFLAKKAGISLKGYTADSAGEGLKETLLAINAYAAAFFTDNLNKSGTASDYLAGRGLSNEMIGVFSLGYALRDWHALLNHLRHKGVSEDHLLQCGLVSTGEKGSYDTFRDRIMFPICTMQGDVIAFGGRVMDGSQPKYLNSADTRLFKKGETLYGLNLAREEIKKKGYAFIVEGYFDLIACHQRGYRNTVAPLGTALTAGHLKKLKRLTRRVVLLFDGDEAGKTAAARSLPALFEHGFMTPRVIILPERQDPDTFLRTSGGPSLDDLLGKACSAIDFVLSLPNKDKAELVHDSLALIALCGDPIVRAELLRELADKSGINEIDLRETVRRSVRASAIEIRHAPPRLPERITHDEEVLLLSAALNFPERFGSIMEEVNPSEFRNERVRAVFEKLLAAGGAEGIDSLLASFPGEEQTLVTRLTLDPGFDLSHADKNIADCIRKMLIRRVDEKLRSAEMSGDLKLLRALLSERKNLMKEAR